MAADGPLELVLRRLTRARGYLDAARTEVPRYSREPRVLALVTAIATTAHELEAMTTHE
jgi:hypothetical protein